jgi:hypothetical protein
MGFDPLLKTVEDKIPILQVFLHRVRHGRCAADKHQVKSRTAEEYIRSVAQTYLSLGAKDPRINKDESEIDFRIRRMLSAYNKKDPPPNRVKPIPVQVIRRILLLAKNNPTDKALVMEADMIALAFFFLLRPGEYTATKSESTPFEFKDVQLWQGSLRLDLLTATNEELLAASFCSLTFDRQKNAQRGETIGQLVILEVLVIQICVQFVALPVVSFTSERIMHSPTHHWQQHTLLTDARLVSHLPTLQNLLNRQ